MRSKDGAPLVIVRSFQLTAKKASMQYKAVDQAVQLAGADGRKATTTYRCSDMDRIVPLTIGIDAALLDAVVFVHQDESLWPLGDTATLKKKFDDIFAATKYTKALESLRKARLEAAGAAKVAQKELETLRAVKKHADEVEASLAAARVKVDRLAGELGDLARAAAAGEAAAGEADAAASTAAAAAAKRSSLGDAAVRAHAACTGLQARLVSAHGEAAARMRATDARASLDSLATVVADARRRAAATSRAAATAQAEVDALRDEIAKDERRVARLEADAAAAARARGARDAEACKAAPGFGVQLPAEGPLSDDDFGRVLAGARSAADGAAAALDAARTSASTSEAAAAAAVDRASADAATARQAAASKKAEADRAVARAADLRAQAAAAAVGAGAAAARAAADREAAARAEVDRLAAELERSDFAGAVDAALKRGHDAAARAGDLRAERSRAAATVDAAASARARERAADAANKALAAFVADGPRRARLRALLSLPPGADPPPPSDLAATADAAVARLREAEASADAVAAEAAKAAARAEATASARAAAAGGGGDAASSSAALSTALGTIGIHHADPHVLPDVPALAREAAAAAATAAKRVGRLACAKSQFDYFLAKADAEHLCDTCARPIAEAEEASFRAKQRGAAVGAERKLADQQAALDAATVRAAALQDALPLWDRARRAADSAAGAGGVGADTSRAAAADAADAAAAARAARQAAETVAREDAWRATEMAAAAVAVAAAPARGSGATQAGATQAAALRRPAEIDADLEEVELQRERADQDRNAALRRLETKRAALAAARSELDAAREDGAAARTAAAKKDQLLEAAVELEGSADALRCEAASLEPVAAAAAASMVAVVADRDAARARGRGEEEAAAAAAGAARAAVDRLTALAAAADAGGGAAPADVDRARGALETAKGRLAAATQAVAEKAAAATEAAAETTSSDAARRRLDDVLAWRAAEAEVTTADAAAAAAEAASASAGDAAELARAAASARAAAAAAKSASDRAEGAVDEARAAAAAAAAALARNPEFAGVAAAAAAKAAAAAAADHASKDVERYHAALERALLAFHSSRMAVVNAALRELWQKTYRGGDVDRIAVRADADAKSARSHNYRLVMVAGGAELEMRGRASAGQKVLAAVLVRLALSEAFAGAASILTLDEPTTNLDAAHSAALADALKAVLDARGGGGGGGGGLQLVIITHDEAFARALGARTLTDTMWRVTKDGGQTSTIRRVPVLEDD